VPVKKKSPAKSKEASKGSGSRAAEEFEKLGVFYLGRPYDLVAKEAMPGWLLYDSKDLVTHAVCVGMTGSGKTGLCIGLLEEAAIDGIPAIVIDPKGDLANLLLTFPQLRGEDFAPWINEDDARKKGLSPGDFATQQAELWKKGLSEWGQDGGRIQRLRDAADFVVYTPGSNAGLPVSILNAFYAPDSNIIQDVELLRDQIGATVTGLLGLVGLNVDPINSPPHILLSAILEAAWRKGQSLDLIGLIRQVRTPPFTRMGALDIETFYPAEDPTRRDDPAKGRFSLTKRLNNLIAAPSFEIWKEGEPLDIDRMLHTSDGKPRVSIFSIAHLNDAERMFFVTLLLSQILAWMRRQSGTTSLRAILYMDEIFGYIPPVANPPSKAPLLTLLKQGRAFGLGIVLATQNPVDLDYKGLSNAGTWFIGRLQTERDKARLLDGLEGAAAGTGQRFDRKSMEQTLAGLGNRIFLLNNVHEDRPEVFETRWTLSYLRGPLTRNQIKSLMESYKGARFAETSGSLSSPHEKQSFGEQPLLQASRPILPANIHQCILPIRGVQPAETCVVYEPMLFGAALVGFTDAKHTLDLTRGVACLVSITEDVVPVDWNQAVEINVGISELEQSPQKSARYAPLLPVAGKAKAYDVWRKEFVHWLYLTQRLELLRSPTFKEVSKPGESERDFRVRLHQSGREQRDKGLEALRQRYAPKIAALEDRVRRAEHMKEKQQTESRSSQVQAAISVGASILGAFLGRKTISATNIGRTTTAIRSAGRVLKESKDVGHAEENVAALQRRLADLEAQFKSESEMLAAATDPLSEKLEIITVKPIKSNIVVKLVALAWTPYWLDDQGVSTPAWQ
jgi:hypothetical protein